MPQRTLFRPAQPPQIQFRRPSMAVVLPEPPVVVLNSPPDASSDTDTTPTFDFTGTDPNGDDIRYQIEIVSVPPGVSLTKTSGTDAGFVNPDVGGGAVAFRSDSELNFASGTSTTFTAPAGIVDDDVLVLFFWQESKVITPTPPSGFAAIDLDSGSGNDYRDYTTENARCHAWWKRASGESGSYSVTHASMGSAGWLGCYSGCVTSGSPIDVAPTSVVNITDTSVEIPALTTTVNDSVVIAVVGTWNFAENATPPGSFVERFDNGGADSQLYVCDQVFAAAGDTGIVTVPQAADGQKVGFLIPLRAGGGEDTDPFNSGENVQFTVQAGDALAEGVYEWRVRAIDPDGSNTYGEWTTVRTLTIGEAASAATKIHSYRLRRV